MFGLLLQFGVIEEKKEASLQQLSENNRDFSPVLALFFFFEQFTLLVCRVFNTTSSLRRKNVLEDLTDDKSKVKEILREQ